MSATAAPTSSSSPTPAAETTRAPWAGDAWGGLAAMLVALPSAVAYGLVAFAPLGGELGAAGAVAGLIGAVALGLVAPVFGGAPRLITAPCAPAAAVLGATAAQLVSPAGGVPPARALVLLGLLGLFAGVLQVGFAALRGGRLIKYIPYPVVAGYLSGVGALIFFGQLPKVFGWASDGRPWTHVISPTDWRFTSLVVAGATVTAMLLAPRLVQRVPAPIVALAVGTATYFALALGQPQLLQLEGNTLVVGPVGGSLTEIGAGFSQRLTDLGGLGMADLQRIVWPSVTLAVLLSVDTLKTCVVLDALTRSRHHSNHELRGQGLANIASSVLGGMPGAGTMGASLINVHSGATTKRSGLLEGIFALVALLLVGPLVAWIPTAALAGILLVVAVRMVDPHVFALARERATFLDFAVIVLVAITAVVFSLLAAAGVGVALAIMLFLREQVRGTVVRRRIPGDKVFSKKRRLPAEVTLLEEKGSLREAFELQGSLFFGTADQLFTVLEPFLKKCRYIILDMRRVSSVDFTATRMLEQIADRLADRDGDLVLANLPVERPTGQNLTVYFGHVGLTRLHPNVRVVPTLDDGLAWTEDQILRAEMPPRGGLDRPLEVGECELWTGLPEHTLKTIEPLLETRTLQRGEHIFRQGDVGNEIFFIRRGLVRIQLDMSDGRAVHLATFGPGDHFGELEFFDHNERSADAIAKAEVILYVLARDAFDAALETHPELAKDVLGRLGRSLALRLRNADREIEAIEKS